MQDLAWFASTAYSTLQFMHFSHALRLPLVWPATGLSSVAYAIRRASGTALQILGSSSLDRFPERALMASLRDEF